MSSLTEGCNNGQISTTFRSSKKDDIQEDEILREAGAGLVQSIFGLTKRFKSPPSIKMVSEKLSKVDFIESKK